jgi:glycosyltransferase involved in cell wall biosynthesis
MARPRVLVLCLDAVGPRMAGIAIRSCEIARALAPHAEVTLAAARIDGDAGVGVPVVPFDRHDGRTLAPRLDGVDAIVAQPQWPLVSRVLERSGARLIFDLGCPEALETLDFRSGDDPRRRRLVTAMTIDRTIEALHTGHHFVASTERQLDLWIGAMLAERLLDPRTYDADRGLGARLALVPHGLPADPPVRGAGPGLRGTIDGVDAGDEVVLWNSAIWQWLDAETPIRAMALLSARRPRAKLVFLGASDRPSGRAAHEAAKRRAGELGLLDRHVFFNEGWVPYEERGDWLLDADCAVACHERHLETRFAFRTRYLDCLWAGLPTVCTEGDVLADRIADEELGLTVPERDPEAVAAALETVLERGRAAFAPQLARAAADYAWPVATGPIVDLVLGGPPPERLGARARRRPGHVLRSTGYRAVRTALNAAGLHGPRGLRT